jgi:hypothetical protein
LPVKQLSIGPLGSLPRSSTSYLSEGELIMIYILESYLSICFILWILAMRYLFPKPNNWVEWILFIVLTLIFSVLPVVNFKVITDLAEKIQKGM